MPTAAIRGRSFSPPFAKSSGKSTWKSSSVPIQQRALRSCPSDGSSSAPSPGSIAAAAWPRIGSASTERPWRSCALPQSASCSESSVKKQHDPGQTLRLIQLTLGILRTNISFDREGQRVETTEVPSDVLREAISNAISHRDYAGNGTVLVRVKKDSI